ncbi:MAG: lysoplasmalogenase [Deltaproteobacteria bacterium]
MTVSGIFLILFIILSIVHIACEARRSLAGRYVTKPFLMPALGLYYMASAAQPDFVLMAAIACGWLGDIFLMLPDPRNMSRYFKMGLAAFLLGHIFYIALFAAYLPGASNVPVWGWICLPVYIAAGIAGYRIIAPHAGSMLPVVMIYIVVIVLMAASTILPLGNVNTTGAVTVMAGALLFMVSDAVNACNRFVGEPPLEWLLTMGTYLAGQFLLVQGYLLF